MISSCVSAERAWSKTQMMVGLVQMLTAIYLIGWIFSIYWGYLILMKGLEDKQEVQSFLSRTNARSEGGMRGSGAS